jgi:hypothetical protein
MLLFAANIATLFSICGERLYWRRSVLLVFYRGAAVAAGRRVVRSSSAGSSERRQTRTVVSKLPETNKPDVLS